MLSSQVRMEKGPEEAGAAAVGLGALTGYKTCAAVEEKHRENCFHT